jgi:phage terminase large subunit-like protein
VADRAHVGNYPDDINLALFGGRGAGRTTGALFCAAAHVEMYGPRAHVLFIRQTLRSLREVEDNFQQILTVAFHGLKFNRQDHEFRFPNGATAEFAPINDTEDMAKLQGRSFSLIIADEYGNFSPQQMRFVDQLRANLRAGN